MDRGRVLVFFLSSLLHKLQGTNSQNVLKLQFCVSVLLSVYVWDQLYFTYVCKVWELMSANMCIDSISYLWTVKPPSYHWLKWIKQVERGGKQHNNIWQDPSWLQRWGCVWAMSQCDTACKYFSICPCLCSAFRVRHQISVLLKPYPRLYTGRRALGRQSKRVTEQETERVKQ